MTTKIDTYLENYRLDDRKTWRGKPDNLVKVRNIGGNYPLVWLYKGAGGKAMVAVGCRRFTIEYAHTHWGSLDIVYSSWQRKAPGTLNEAHTLRAARSKVLSDTVLAQCSRKARRLGWNTGRY